LNAWKDKRQYLNQTFSWKRLFYWAKQCMSLKCLANGVNIHLFDWTSGTFFLKEMLCSAYYGHKWIVNFVKKKDWESELFKKCMLW